MIVEVTSATDKMECRDYLKIEIDGKQVFEVADGEPEDNNLSRNFNDCFSIGELISDAFHAGRDSTVNGEGFLLINKIKKWEDV